MHITWQRILFHYGVFQKKFVCIALVFTHIPPTYLCPFPLTSLPVSCHTHVNFALLSLLSTSLGMVTYLLLSSLSTLITPHLWNKTMKIRIYIILRTDLYLSETESTHLTIFSGSIHFPSDFILLHSQVKFSSAYMPHFHYLFFCLRTSRLVPFPPYCEWSSSNCGCTSISVVV